MSGNRRTPRVFAAGELEAVLASAGVVLAPSPPPQPPPTPEGEASRWVPAGFSDAEVRRELFECANGEEYRQLYAGELSYDDASSGDWRLIKAVAWIAGPDADQVDRIMRASGRVRSKWDERRGATTLLRWQINKAIAEHLRDDSFYDVRGANALPWFKAGDGTDDDEAEEAVVAATAVAADSSATTNGTAGSTTGSGVTDSEDLPSIPDYPVACLPETMRDLVEAGVRRGLDGALVAGAALAAAAAAIGNQVDVMAMIGWLERPILWVPLIALPGVAKSHAQELAFGPLRALNEVLLIDYADQLEAWRNEPVKTRPATPPKDPSLLSDDVTLESLARIMDGNGALGADLDELSAFLTGLGQYKVSASSDRARLLRLWTGGPWRYTRVGGGGHGTNAVNILIPRPTLIICGSLPTEQHSLLGDDRDGLRPRFLPHLAAALEREVPDLVDVDVTPWRDALDKLVNERTTKRTWHLADAAKQSFQLARRDWKHQVHGNESASTAAALAKADVHALRTCLVFAELEAPGQAAEVSNNVMEAAVEIIQYTLGCWRALGSAEHLSLSFRDEQLNSAIPRLVAWLERHGPVNSDLIRQNRVGGVHTADELKALLARYAAIYPGSVQSQPTGGRPVVLVSPPARRRGRP